VERRCDGGEGGREWPMPTAGAHGECRIEQTRPPLLRSSLRSIIDGLRGRDEGVGAAQRLNKGPAAQKIAEGVARRGEHDTNGWR